MTNKLTAIEIKQCHSSIDHTLNDFREARADMISIGVMTESEADQQEQQLMDLRVKLSRLYYELVGE